MVNLIRKIWKWILIGLLIAFFIFLSTETEAASGIWIDVTENYNRKVIEHTKDDQKEYYYSINGLCSNDLDYTKGYFVFFYGNWAQNEKYDVDMQVSLFQYLILPKLVTNVPYAKQDIVIEKPEGITETNYPVHTVYKSNSEAGYITTCFYKSKIKENLGNLEYKVYYYTGDIFTESTDIYSTYDAANNPKFDDKIYSKIITKTTDLRSDLTLLNIPFTDFYYDEGYKLKNQIITFSLAYEPGTTYYNLVCYLYYNGNLKKGDLIYMKPELNGENENKTALGLEKWSVVSSQKHIHKLEFKESASMALNTVVKKYNKVQYSISSIYLNIPTNKTMSDLNKNINSFYEYRIGSMLQYFQFLNEPSADGETRSSSCVLYNEDKIIVDAITYGYYYDAQHNSIWHHYLYDIDYNVFITYFNVYEYGVKWEDVQIKNIKYTYTDTIIDRYIWKNIYGEKWHDKGITYNYRYIDADGKQHPALTKDDNNYVIEAEADISNHVKITFPANTKANFWAFRVKDFIKYEKLDYLQLFTLGDNSNLENKLKLSENYDPKVHSGYEYGMVIGNGEGYPVVSNNSYICPKHLCEAFYSCYHELKVKDFLEIVYVEDGKNYCVKVDETHSLFGGYIVGDKAPVEITYSNPKNPFDVFKEIWKIIKNVLMFIPNIILWLLTNFEFIILGVTVWLLIKFIRFIRRRRKEKKEEQSENDNE